MIREPQRKYVLELYAALGSAADNFVLAGAQAMRFALPRARATRDFDFVLDVLALRKMDVELAEIFQALGYTIVQEARNFQFEKKIPDSAEVMRIELMAPSEHKDKNDFRVAVHNIHGRACAGGTIVLAESDEHEIHGVLPTGKPASAKVRITRPVALVMMKFLALHDRYINLRGPKHRDHDRNRAQTHAADIVDILTAQADLGEFRMRFFKQFDLDLPLKEKTLEIVRDYFGEQNQPGLLLYEEILRERLSIQETSPRTLPDELQRELQRAQRLVASLLTA